MQPGSVQVSPGATASVHPQAIIAPRTPRIITVGAAIQDVFLSNSAAFSSVKIDATHEMTELQLGAKIDVNKVDFATGGGATNAAVTFARQELDTSFMGMIGEDLAGDAILTVLDAENINTSRVKTTDKYNTDYSTVILAPNGERTILTYRGASSQIDGRDFEVEPGEFDWLYVSNLAGKMDDLNEIFSRAAKSGIKIAWNPGKKELQENLKMKSLLSDVEVLLVNKEEASQIFTGETLEELVHHGLNLVPVIIITDGPNGAIASDGKTVVRAGMYEDIPSLDRTGAGDAFGSGFVSQWAQGASLKQSLLFASANSTSVIQFMGAKEGILRKGAELHSMPMREEPIR